MPPASRQFRPHLPGTSAGKVIAALLLLLAAQPSAALPDDTLRPYAEYTVHHDSNYFRLANDSQARALLGTTDTAVTIRKMGIGLDADVQISRQALSLRTNAHQMRFDRRELQDQHGSDIIAQWNWLSGNDWSGELGSHKSVEILSQADFMSLEANVQGERNTYFNANYHPHPDWVAKSGIGKSFFNYSATSRAVLDHEDSTVSFGLAFVSPRGSRFGADCRRIAGQYPHRPAPDDYFEQSEMNLSGEWSPGGHTRIRGEAGYASRKQNQFVQRQPTWRVSANWSAGQSTLAASLQRLILTSDSVTSSASNVMDGADLGITWAISAKTELAASVRAETREYSGIARVDRLLTRVLKLAYQPTRSIQINPVFEMAERSSNIAAAGFRYRTATLNIRANF